jgi:hypothetical protein
MPCECSTATASSAWSSTARARGDAREDSDYDIAVFLKDMREFGIENSKLSNIGVDILIDTGAVINPLAMNEGAWRNRTIFMHGLREDGIDL